MKKLDAKVDQIEQNTNQYSKEASEISKETQYLRERHENFLDQCREAGIDVTGNEKKARIGFFIM